VSGLSDVRFARHRLSRGEAEGLWPQGLRYL
jgi:hypothetical protein